MLIKEFRIPLPLELDEFRRGQLYSVARASKHETGGGEGAEFIKQYNFYDDPNICPGKSLSGFYTRKIYRLKSRAPWALQKLLPDEAFEVHEESWNAYPYCRTILTNPGYMRENFTIIIESIHLQDNGCSENPLNAQKKREIIYLDICDDNVIGKPNYRPETDPKIFKSERKERGLLRPNWVNSTTPVMCCYKLVTIEFKWMGLSTFIETMIIKQYSKIFANFHRNAFCWLDYWYDLSDEELHNFEQETAVQLRKLLAEPEKRGVIFDDTCL
ncbi:phosphatidylinositol transfer protein [Dictyocaulus viviparus]|uniref:Phosphatidylinositol transfer protein n=1 Tax=Dictyocaulus viviparus TaxID=29172 RepID=A0A0D8Y8S9_DICVI|nr:phosphatidylinositol transfer protein [Dictyocaulus viviparus]